MLINYCAVCAPESTVSRPQHSHSNAMMPKDETMICSVLMIWSNLDRCSKFKRLKWVLKFKFSYKLSSVSVYDLSLIYLSISISQICSLSSALMYSFAEHKNVWMTNQSVLSPVSSNYLQLIVLQQYIKKQNFVNFDWRTQEEKSQFTLAMLASGS